MKRINKRQPKLEIHIRRTKRSKRTLCGLPTAAVRSINPRELTTVPPAWWRTNNATLCDGCARNAGPKGERTR